MYSIYAIYNIYQTLFLLDMWCANIFPFPPDLCFNPFESLHKAKVFKFEEVPFMNLSYVDHAFKTSINFWIKCEIQATDFFFPFLFMAIPLVKKASVIQLLSYLFQNPLSAFMWLFFWVHCSVPLIYVSITLPVSHCPYYYSYKVSLSIGQNDALTLFLCQDCFHYSTTCFLYII